MAVIVKEKWTCQNTAKLLGERSVRKVLAELGATVDPVIPKSVRTFLNKTMHDGVAKRSRSADLYASYLDHCRTRNLPQLNRDKFTQFLKTAVPHCRLENGAVTIAYGLTLKKTSPVRFVTFTRAARSQPQSPKVSE